MECCCMRFEYRWLCVFLLFFALLFPQQVAAQVASDAYGKCNDVKFTLLSLGSGSTRITYERAFNQRNSGEITLGVVGWGWDWMNHSHPRGLLMKMAYKWRLVPQQSSNSWLAGFYVKPEFVWSQFSYGNGRRDYYGEPPKCPERTLQVALLAECGYQWVLDWFVFDVYAGLGPSLGTGNGNNYYHSFMLFPEEGWLAFTAGFRVGVAF